MLSGCVEVMQVVRWGWRAGKLVRIVVSGMRHVRMGIAVSLRFIRIILLLLGMVLLVLVLAILLCVRVRISIDRSRNKLAR